MRPSVSLIAVVFLSCAAPAHAQEVIEYYGTDHLGSVRVVFDAAGNVTARADYLPFGEEIFAPTGPMPAEQFTGQARDGEAGQDYFHARMFQPRTGRFNAVDPVYAGHLDPQQWGRYAYARNNPVSLVDPSGEHIANPNGGVCSAEFQNCNGDPDSWGTAWFVPIGWPPVGGGWQPPSSSPPPNQPPPNQPPPNQPPPNPPPTNPPPRPWTGCDGPCNETVAQFTGFFQGIRDSLFALNPRDGDTSCYTVFAANLGKNLLPAPLVTSPDPSAVINEAAEYAKRGVALEANEFSAANERKWQLTGTRRTYRSIVEKGRYAGKLAFWAGAAWGVWDAVGSQVAAGSSGKCK